MNLYLDASALVKEYLIGEPGARDVAAVRGGAELVGTSAMSPGNVGCPGQSRSNAGAEIRRCLIRLA